MNKRIRVRKSQLKGKVRISGAKNSGLKLLTASLLTSQPTIISDMPIDILDIKAKIGMLKGLGKRIYQRKDSGDIIIREEKQISNQLDWQGRDVRTSLLILGALLARTGGGKVPKPGGCKIGDRSYDLHQMAIEKFGAKFWEDDKYLYARARDGLKPAEITLPIRSTGATENVLLMASLIEGKTKLWLPHIRPIIIDLIKMLKKMGAKIKINGQESIEIIGSKKLKGVKHQCLADNAEALTYAVAAGITKGRVEILNFPVKDVEIPLIYLKEAGLNYQVSNKKDKIFIKDSQVYPLEVATLPYPGINSDVQPILAVWALNAKANSKIIDLRFPERYQYIKELEKIGGSFKVNKEGFLVIKPGELRGAEVRATDLRGGAALVLAGLVAEGETLVSDIEEIKRGYPQFVDKIKALGGDIELI